MKARDWVITAVMNKWTMDQLIRNVVLLQSGSRLVEYTRMPDGSYISPPGDSSRLHKSDDHFVVSNRFGVAFVFNTNGYITSWADADGNTLNFTYSGGANLTEVEDCFGRSLSFSYTGGLVSSVDSEGRSVSLVYSNADLISCTDPEGFSRTYAYDTNSEHLLTALHDPLSQLIASNTYNSLGAVESQTFGTTNTWNFYICKYRGVEEDPQGGRTTHYFDEVGRNIGTMDALSNRISHIYDGQGHVVTNVDAKGNVTTYEFDANNNLTNIINALGQRTAYSFDGENRLVRITDAMGNVAQFGYDSEHHLTNRVDALGHAWSMTYTDSGQLNTMIDPRMNASTLGYDDWGNLEKIQRPDAGTITNEFDTLGNLLYVRDPLGRATRFTYDKRRLLTGITDARGYSVSNVYDAAGNLVESIDANGNTNAITYTAFNNISSVTYADGGVAQFLYDSREWLASATDPMSNTTSNRYDIAGHLIAVVDALEHPSGMGYDQNGNVVSVTNQLDKAWARSYDPLNRPTAWVDPLGHSNIVEYDSLGRTVASTDANGLRTEYTFDALGHVTSQVHPDGAKESFEYDPVGNLTAFVNGKGLRTVFTYDGMNRRLSETNADGHGISFAYDVAGNIVSRRDANGATTQYGYDAANSLTNISYPDSSAIVYQYDANRSLSSVSSANSVVTYAYDVMNRMVSSTTRVSGVESTVFYRYDLNGNRVSITYPGSLVVSNIFDQLNRLATVKDWGGRETHYSYDDASSPTGTLYPNGIRGVWAWDDARRLSELAYVGTTTAFIDRVFTRDAIGNRMQEEILAGLAPTLQPKVERVSFDQADRLQEVLTKATPNDAAWTTNDYTFDPNGNLISNLTGLAFSYDYDNKATNVMMAGYTNQYEYDGLGDRIRRTVNGTTYIDVLDRGAALPNVLVELNDSGEPVRYFVWGLTLIAQIETNGSVYYAHADELGSTLALTDTNGTIVAEYAYGPYGEILDHTGTVDTPYTFVGGYGVWHDGAGLYQMKARQYSEALRRFTTADPIGLMGGANLYGYCANNPINFLDPFGMCSGNGPSYSQLVGNALNNTVSAINQSVGQIVYDITQGKLSQNVYNQIGNQMWSTGTPAAPGATPYIAGALGISSAATIVAVAIPVAKNVKIDGPSPRGGRIVQVRWGSTPLLRLDYHPIPGSAATPVLHVNIGPGQGDDSIHIRIWPLR